MPILFWALGAFSVFFLWLGHRALQKDIGDWGGVALLIVGVLGGVASLITSLALSVPAS